MEKKLSNPYVGLRPFNDTESLLFFGRNQQTLELLQKLHKHHFVAVVGSSGCGKSSLLRAGLIPALKAGYLVNDSDNWMIAIMKPGQSPLHNLSRAILEQLYQSADRDAITQLAQTIEEEGIDAILSLFSGLEKKTNFFLLVDQFEELFRFASEKRTRQQQDQAIDFVNIILELARQQVIPIYVVLTMRSDFIGDCSEFFGLPEAMNQSLYLVPKLSRQQLKLVIEGPAKLNGNKVNSALTSKLLNELGKIKDELPLLQHALMRMWDYERNIGKDGEINLDDYNAIGGIEKALSIHADEALKTLSKEEFQVAKQLFQSLTTVDEHGRKTRRPVHFKELLLLTGTDSTTLDRVINAFIKDQRSFLMVDQATDKNERIIDISHESLIRQWSRLGRWVEEEGEAAAHYYKLTQDYRLHEEGKKDFLTGTELELAQEWHDSFKPTEIWASRYNPDFKNAIKYLEDSKQEHKRVLRNQRKRKGLYISALAAVILALLGFLTKELIESKREADAANQKKEELMAELKNLYDNAATDESEDTGQNQALYLEGYKQVLDWIGSQQAFYKNNKRPDELGQFVYDSNTDVFEDEADLIYQGAKDSILAREKRIDSHSWSLVLNDNTTTRQKSIDNYLKSVESFIYWEPRHIEEAKKLSSVDPEWVSATSKNTVNAYVVYLKHLQDTYGERINVPIEKKAYLETALKNIDDSRRQGWLYAGRKGESSNMDSKDRIFSVVYREGFNNVKSDAVPEKGDIIRMMDSKSRNVYKDFTGSSVANKNAEIIKEKDYAMVKEVEQLVGGAIFIQISY
ncbi:hypothetical protein ACOCEA_03325 [Maribacter sp. CXY002]|uniref:nSTAND1 domain-containing NTPase n=1 Tax=Maribacter luteocoastalis TaxID=3407671 RepID=UPI003B68319D